VYKILEYGNSVKLIYKKIENVSSVSLGLWFNVGSRNESASLNGISHFLEHLVFKGSKNYTGDQIKESIEGVGGALNAFTSEESTCYYAKFLGKHLSQVSRVLGDMVLRPLLKKEDIEKERTVILEEIKMYKDLPPFLVQELFDTLLWPDHPLGRNIAGTVDSVAKISRSEILDYHGCWYSPASLIISCAGNLDEKLLEDYVVKNFSNLKQSACGPFLPFVRSDNGPQVKIISKDIEQTHLNLGFPSLERSHKDRFILGLLHVILGGNMSSRLFNEVREKKGLAYEIATQTKKLKDTGVFYVHAGVDNKKLIEAVTVIFKELDKIRTEKVSAGELRRAKDFYSAQTEMALDDSLEHMLWMGESLMNLGFLQTKEEARRQIERTTSADILRLARELVSWPKLHFAAVGPQPVDDEDRIKEMVRVLS
jgi:predicted Zn-dependent peptidase